MNVVLFKLIIISYELYSPHLQQSQIKSKPDQLASSFWSIKIFGLYSIDNRQILFFSLSSQDLETPQ